MKSIVMAVFRPEAQLTLFLHMRTKEIAKTQQKCILIHKLFTCYRKSGSPMWMTKSDFWPGAQFTKNRKFLLSLS